MSDPALPDAGRTSWIESANDPDCGFPLQGLPYCVFVSDIGMSRPGVGIGAFILDLSQCRRSGLFAGLPASVQVACEAQTLNALVACHPDEHAAFRARLVEILDTSTDDLSRESVRAALLPRDGATLHRPISPPNFTDFYTSIHHATSVGRLFRPEQPLLPNYKHIPIGYHGRASSVVVSGTPVRRPRGQTRPDPTKPPVFGPTRFLDYELEIGVYTTGQNALGFPIGIDDAAQNLFGLSLLNDWSARDIQSWEYQPLGPFLAKSFATSVSPWVVPMAALAPFRVPAASRDPGDPKPLDYLWSSQDQENGAFDITLEAFLFTSRMRESGEEPHRLTRSSLRDQYWTLAQMVAHHTVNGCNLQHGDLLATGTVSGPEEDSAGCLLELAHGGAKPILLPNRESRTTLEDGDEIILRGVCRREGIPEISFGECRGLILPAL